MKKKSVFVACGLLLSISALSIAAPKVSLEGVKCLIASKKDANESKSAKWKEGQVYFCCDGCLSKFSKMDDKGKEKIAAAANHQLVATKQYKQEACPVSGRPLDPALKVKVKGVEVGFCCGGCKSSTEKLDEDKQIAKVFSEKAFKKAKFAPVKKSDS
ncbi:MAG: hypothetical protein ACE361_11270 [Aureliella sp.]